MKPVTTTNYSSALYSRSSSSTAPTIKTEPTDPNNVDDTLITVKTEGDDIARMNENETFKVESDSDDRYVYTCIHRNKHIYFDLIKYSYK